MNNLILTKNFKKKVIIHMNNQILNLLNIISYSHE